MTALIRLFLRSPVAANLLMAALVAAGLASALTVTIRTFPEITTGAVTVTVAYPGATPTEVADAILVPIEERLQGLEGVRKLTGRAQSGVGVVTADLTRGADVRRVKDEIETEIARITTFPDAAESPRVAERDPDELAVQFVLHGDVPVETLKNLAQIARDEMTAKPEISQVILSGVPVDLIEIAVDRSTLQAYGIGLAELGERIAAQSLDLSGGAIDTGESDIQIRTVGEAESADELRDKILFTSDSGAQVTLGDVARIQEVLAETDITASVSGEPAVFISANRAGSEEVLSVADTAIEYLEAELRPRLPPGVEVTIWRNEADSLRGRINLLMKNGAIGVTLILAVLMLFLDLRVAAWVAIGVVVAFIGAFAPMLLFGTTINQLSLFGFILALGIVVDDAIVVGENTFAELETGEPDGAAERAVIRVWRPVFFAVSTTICAFVPLLFLPGSSGSFIAPIASVVIFVLTASLIESYFVLPRHLSRIRLHPPRRWSPRRPANFVRGHVDRWFDRFREGPIRRVVTGSVRHPVFAIAVCLAVALAGLGLLTGGIVRFVFFPAIEGNFVTAQLNLPEGTSEIETRARAVDFVVAAERAAEAIGEEGLLQQTAISIGFSARGGDPDGSSGVNPASTAQIEVKLMDAATRDTAAERFKQVWRDEVGEVPGAKEVIFSSSIVGVGAAVNLEVAADTEAARDAATRKLREALADRPGTFDIRDDSVSAAQEITIDLRPAARVFGVTLEEVAREVRGAFYGIRVDQFARDREEVDIRLRLPQDQRDSVADLQKLRIPTAQGMVPLPVLADLAFQPAPTAITRIDGRSVTTLLADVNEAVTTGGEETAYLMAEVVPQLREDHPSLRVSAGGEQEEQGRFLPALALNFSLALFAIYALLSLAFGSYFRPLIVLGVIPFGFVGALIGHALLGLNLTILSLFGVIGLAGVIVNDALLIVDFTRSREADGEAPLDAIVGATLGRFRPVTLTTLTTFLGIAPLILETSVQAQFLIPTAVSLGMGVLFGSILQMILVPAYSSLGARVAARWRGGRAAPA
ncbi:Multidrug transporter MdtB [Jannaschia seosinensis]|uniref:Multidrug transporter MdtB n=1 Tax=Jannaschia seosinensis TaxID=313367 RepID=A0A0M7BC62_9RHOB|nr:efflux RND transporter permease subunit [Jannaschia seosinensis]CUH40387.1 Multidrug transporter MdtB [Jannaschia seosinensis]